MKLIRFAENYFINSEEFAAIGILIDGKTVVLTLKNGERIIIDAGNRELALVIRNDVVEQINSWVDNAKKNKRFLFF